MIKEEKERDNGFKEFNKEVFYATDRIISLKKRKIDLFKEKAKHNERKRIRICTHKDVDDKLHEMFIIHEKGIYIRPHKHLNKSESLHVIEGEVSVVFFDDKGNIINIIKMGDYLSGKEFYYRISDPYYHTLFITSDSLVFHETTSGPFDKTKTVFAPWSPDENDVEGVNRFMEKIKGVIKHEK